MNFIWWIFRKSKTEIKIVLGTLTVLVFLPAIVLVVLAASGIAIVGNALAAVNPITHMVSIFDPNGKEIRQVELSTVWPARGYVSDEFGTLSTERSDMGLGPHTGIDIANEKGQTGAPITPFMSGKVTRVHDKDDNTCGKYVKLDHGNGITSLYCHMIETATTKDADVKPGDVIGYVGSTGISTGAHVHFQIMIYDIPVNPRIFMVGDPTATGAP
jgi:murein DD-endopeptidase MepM/ murein hydrolase activator NlpD